jgi:hypothetical protein
MPDSLVEEVRRIQAVMLEAGKSGFQESELEALRAVIRLTVEFSHYSQEDLNRRDLRYLCGSVFSGIESFCAVRDGMESWSLQFQPASTLDWSALSADSLKSKFASHYQEFLIEENFEKRCRLLLDLFKLQIVFAGMCYD